MTATNKIKWQRDVLYACAKGALVCVSHVNDGKSSRTIYTLSSDGRQIKGDLAEKMIGGGAPYSQQRRIVWRLANLSDDARFGPRGRCMTPMTEAQFLSQCAGPRHTPEDTFEAIQELLRSFGYEDAARHVALEWELINIGGDDDDF